MRTVAIVAITALSLGLAATETAVAKSAPQPPNNAGSTSTLVRYAYFTNVDHFPTELRRVSDFPVAIKEFEAAKQSAVVFVGAIDSPGKDFTVTGLLRGPDGTRVELFSETKKYSPDVKWYPVRRMISMSRLQPASGGKWSLELQIDGQPVGTYGFEVAPDLVLAAQEKAAKEKQVALEKAAPAPSVPSVQPAPPSGPSVLPIDRLRSIMGSIKVEFDGPPRLKFRVDGKEHALDDKGRLDLSLSAAEHEIEVKGGGFKPLKEMLKLSTDKKVVQHKLVPEDAVAPAIVVLEPRPGTGPVLTEDAKLKLEVKGEARLSAVRILSGGRVVERLTVDPRLKPGEAVVLQTVVRLAEGDNQFTIEAEDDNEKAAKRTVDIERERLIAVELKTEPFAKLLVNKREFNVDRTGTLSLRLLPGEYEIEVTKPGLKAASERMTLVRGQRSVQREVAMSQVSAPTIALLEPAQGADPVIGDDAKVKIEVKGDGRLTTLRLVRDGRVLERFVPDSRYRPGQPWVVESTVRSLVEGDNSFTLEAEDDAGRPAKKTIVVARERLIPVELRGEPSARVSVNKREFTLSSSGSLALRLLPGNYQIEATKPGFKPFNETLTVKRGESAVAYKVEPRRADPPTIALLEPKDGAEVNDPRPDIKVEVRSTERLTALKVAAPGMPEMTTRPKPNAPRGEAWISEAPVRLAQGPNEITLEAVDEHGQKTTKTVKIVYVPQVVRAEPPTPAVTSPPAPPVPSDPAPPSPPSGTRPPGGGAPAGVEFGRYHALIIGNQKYDVLKSLTTPVNDAQEVGQILKTEYGYQVRVISDATRYSIVTALEEYRKKLTERDNLLIYYAGHGTLDKTTDVGFWLPVDAEPDSQANWLANADITRQIKAMRAKHILVVADSCYSGTLTRDIKVSLDPNDIAKVAARRARSVMTSGGEAPVSDVGADNHSVFAKAFLDVLKNNDKKYVEASSLFAQIKRRVMLQRGKQQPEYTDMREAGHDDGEFFFVRR